MEEQSVITSQPHNPSRHDHTNGSGANQGDVEIKRMTREDAEFVARMTVESFRSKFEWAVGKSNIEGAKRIQHQVHENQSDMPHNVFVAWYKGQRAGTVTLMFPGDVDRSDVSMSTYCRELGCWHACRMFYMGSMLKESSLPPHVCYVDHICVDSEFRGKGVGGALLDQADEEARKRGCNMIYLWVAQQNRATNLYKRVGYNITEDTDGICITYCAVGIRKFYKMEKRL